MELGARAFDLEGHRHVDSTRQCDRARYAAELAAAKYAAAGDDRGRYHALMLLAGNWRVDTGAKDSLGLILNGTLRSVFRMSEPRPGDRGVYGE